MNARQKKKQASRLVKDKQVNIKVSNFSKKLTVKRKSAKRKTFRLNETYRAKEEQRLKSPKHIKELARFYEDPLRSGFMRVGLIDKTADGIETDDGIATSIRNNLLKIGYETANIKHYENATWFDIVVEALATLDEADIRHDWINEYFKVAPTYSDGFTDDVGRKKKKKYITQPQVGREVFKKWAESLLFNNYGEVPNSLID